ncbi:MAG: fibronectin type III domain-containing protein, partial [bacterium]
GGGGGGGQSYADPTYTSGVLDTVNGGQFPPGVSLAYLTFDDSAPTKTIVAGEFASWRYNAGPAATYALASGALPPGMTLGSGGVLAGTPVSTGVYTFAVSASQPLETYGGTLVSNTFTSVTVTANGPTSPTSPALVSAVGGSGSATVTWAPPSSTGSSPLVNYVIGWSPNGGQTWSIWAAVPASQTVYTGSLPAGTYVFQVSAVNQTTTGPPSATSNPVTVTAASSAPTNVAGTPGYESVALTWTAPGQTGGAAITGYFIRYSTDAGGSWAQLPNTGSTATSATVGNLTSQAGYIFEVAAINSAGTSPWSAPTGPLYPELDPGAPTDLVAVSAYQAVDLTWRAPPASPVPVTGYLVRYSDDSGATWSTPVATGSTETSYLYAGLTQAQYLVFEVAAVSATGTSAWSAPTGPISPEARSSPPTRLRAFPADRSVTLTWDPPNDLGGGTLTGYRIDIREAGSAQWKVHTASTGTGATRYAVTQLANGTPYEFRVAALTNTFGVGLFSQAASANPYGVPGAPTAVTAVAGDASATITWTAPESDNGRRVVGYRVEAASGTGWYDVVADTGSAATTYSASGLANGTPYLFRVAAINAAGAGAASVPSPQVIPATKPGAPTQVVATARYESIAMRWTAPVDTGGLPLTGYRVRWQASGGAWRSAPTGGPAPYFVLTSLRNGTGYTVQVAAVTAAGRGAWSQPVGPRTPLGVASEPRWLSARPGNGRVQLTWQAPRTTGGAPVEGYVIAVSVADGPWSTQFASAGLTTRIDGLSTTQPYRFRVAAMTAGGRGVWSQPTPSLVLNDTPARPLVTGVSVDAGIATVSVASGSLGDVRLEQWNPAGYWQPVAHGHVTLPRGVTEARVRAVHLGNASPAVRISVDRPVQATIAVTVRIDGDRSRISSPGTTRLEWRYGTAGAWTAVSNPLTLRTPRSPHPWTLQVQAASGTPRDRIGIQIR